MPDEAVQLRKSVGPVTERDWVLESVAVRTALPDERVTFSNVQEMRERSAELRTTSGEERETVAI